MSWYKVDDQSTFHPKVVLAGNECWGAMTRFGSYSSAYLTNGFVPQNIALSICSEAVIDRLVDVNLLDICDGGYSIHDYLDFNPSKDAVLADRARRAISGSKGGKKSAKSKRQAKAQADTQGLTTGLTTVTPQVKVKQKSTPSPSPSPSPSLDPVPSTSIEVSVAEPPARRQRKYSGVPETIEQVIERGKTLGLSELECRKFWDFYHSKGWKVGDHLMVCWHSSLSGWNARHSERNGSRNGRPGDESWNLPFASEVAP